MRRWRLAGAFGALAYYRIDIFDCLADFLRGGGRLFGGSGDVADFAGGGPAGYDGDGAESFGLAIVTTGQTNLRHLRNESLRIEHAVGAEFAGVIFCGVGDGGKDVGLFGEHMFGVFTEVAEEDYQIESDDGGHDDADGEGDFGGEAKLA